MRLVAALLALLGVFLLLDGPHWTRTNEDVAICEGMNVALRLNPASSTAPEDCHATTDPKYAIGCFLLAGLCLLADRPGVTRPAAPDVMP